MLGDGRWGTKNYLKSLHDTYNIPYPRLPGDDSFARVMAHHRAEQTYLQKLEHENETLSAHLNETRKQFDALRVSSQELFGAYQALKDSKRATDGVEHRTKSVRTHHVGGGWCTPC